MGGGGYNGFNYRMVLNDSVVSHGQDDSDYTTTVLQKFGADYLSNVIGGGRPFLLELAPFAPHAPYVPARSEANTFAGLTLEHGVDWNRHPSGAPRWLAGLPPLGPKRINYLNHAFEWRVEAVQTVDRMIGTLVAQLAAADQLRNTVFVFSSDNGYHMGDYGLFAGKQTAFDTDVRVPLVVAGPGIPAGRVDHHLVQNIDLAPTFEQLTGATIPSTVDGRSLVPLLYGQKVPWRTLAGIEHTHPAPVSTDPDKQTASDGTPPSYVAVRSAGSTYVRYADGEREFYDRTQDPAEMHNIYSTLHPRTIVMLNREANALSSCVGTTQCDAAGRPATY
jgi:arylsulfatase A-like enzyme